MTWKELKRRFGAVRLSLLLMTALALVFYLGYIAAGIEREHWKNEIDGLEQSLAAVNKENHRLTQQVHILGVELEVERLANQNNHQELNVALTREDTLQEQLSLYRRVMAPELQDEGISIDSFDARPSLVPGYYDFSLVVMQQKQNKSFVRGRASVVFHGQESGAAAQYDLLSLETTVNGPLDFNFRFFEVLEGRVTFPEGFIPERVDVQFSVRQPERQNVHQRFSWPDRNEPFGDSDSVPLMP